MTQGLYHLNHRAIGRTTAAAGAAAAHARYILRESACAEFEAVLPAGYDGTTRRDVIRWLAEGERADRANARVADRLILALPRELDADAQRELMRRFVAGATQARTPYTYAIHRDHADNPHAHVIIRDRDLETGKRVLSTRKMGSVDAFRELWEQEVNAAYERAGLDVRVDRRSYADQGVERAPQVHLGPRVKAMRDVGLQTDRARLYDEIAEVRAERNAAERALLEAEQIARDAAELVVESVPAKPQARELRVVVDDVAAGPAPTPTPVRGEGIVDVAAAPGDIAAETTPQSVPEPESSVGTAQSALEARVAEIGYRIEAPSPDVVTVVGRVVDHDSERVAVDAGKGVAHIFAVGRIARSLMGRVVGFARRAGRWILDRDRLDRPTGDESAAVSAPATSGEEKKRPVVFVDVELPPAPPIVQAPRVRPEPRRPAPEPAKGLAVAAATTHPEAASIPEPSIAAPSLDEQLDAFVANYCATHRYEVATAGTQHTGPLLAASYNEADGGIVLDVGRRMLRRITVSAEEAQRLRALGERTCVVAKRDRGGHWTVEPVFERSRDRGPSL